MTWKGFVAEKEMRKLSVATKKEPGKPAVTEDICRWLKERKKKMMREFKEPNYRVERCIISISKEIIAVGDIHQVELLVHCTEHGPFISGGLVIEHKLKPGYISRRITQS